MGRRMVAMELIAQEPTRRKTFKVRKECLLKKAHEFKTLCGADDTCVIVYDPDHEDSRAVTTTYPSDPDHVMEIIGRYQRTKKNLSKNVNIVSKGLPDFFKTRKRKMEKEMNKVRGVEKWRQINKSVSVSSSSSSSLSDNELLMMIRSLSWQQLKSLDDTLAARHLMATTEKLAAARRRIYKAVETTGPLLVAEPDKYLEEELYHHLLMDEDDDHHIQYSGSNSSSSVPSPSCDIIHQPQPGQDQYGVPIGTLMAADLNDILLLDYTAAVCNTTPSSASAIMPLQQLQPLIHYQASLSMYQ